MPVQRGSIIPLARRQQLESGHSRRDSEQGRPSALPSTSHLRSGTTDATSASSRDQRCPEGRVVYLPGHLPGDARTHHQQGRGASREMTHALEDQASVPPARCGDLPGQLWPTGKRRQRHC